MKEIKTQYIAPELVVLKLPDNNITPSNGDELTSGDKEQGEGPIGGF